jgi:predicted nucleotidyltransferase
MNSLVEERRSEVQVLCRRYGVLRLDLFGSAATGQDRSGQSDLDFLVEFLPLAPGRYADAYFGLLESLQDLFGRPVDLVVASSIKNPYFRETVERTKALLYAA